MDKLVLGLDPIADAEWLAQIQAKTREYTELPDIDGQIPTSAGSEYDYLRAGTALGPAVLSLAPLLGLQEVNGHWSLEAVDGKECFLDSSGNTLCQNDTSVKEGWHGRLLFGLGGACLCASMTIDIAPAIPLLGLVLGAAGNYLNLALPRPSKLKLNVLRGLTGVTSTILALELLPQLGGGLNHAWISLVTTPVVILLAYWIGKSTLIPDPARCVPSINRPILDRLSSLISRASPLRIHGFLIPGAVTAPCEDE